MMKQGKRTAAVALAAAVVVSASAAQDAGTPGVEGRLLEILKSRGVISAAEFGELRRLEQELRTSADVEKAVDTRIEEMVARVAQDAPKVGYKPGSGFTFATADKNFSLNVGGRLQARFTYDAFENETNGTPAGTAADPGEDRLDFSVPRMRLWFKGVAFDPRLKYELQFDVAGDQATGASGTSYNGVQFGSSKPNANRLAELKDAYVDYQVTDNKALNVKFGQYKVQYSRQQMTSSGRLEFVDRAPTDAWFAPGRVPGLSAWGTMGGEKEDIFEWYAGAFNGGNMSGTAYLEGENVANDDNGLLYNARVAWNPMGGVPYAQADLRPEEDRGTFLLAVGANAWFHDDDNRRADGDTFAQASYGVDVTAMWDGWFFTGEAHWRDSAQRNSTSTATPPVTTSYDDIGTDGWFAQLGYCVIPQKFDVGFRWSVVDFDNTTASTSISKDGITEWLVTAGWYWNEHACKLQADFGRVEDHAVNASSNVDEWRFRLQFQLIF